VTRENGAGITGILSDLLPATYVSELVKGHSHVPLKQVRVVVLQLDIVGFTKLSSSLPHTMLADLVNALFSEFDEAVIGRDLFKLDTIGDAYLLVGWLPEEDDDDDEDAAAMGGARRRKSSHRSIEKQQAEACACLNVLAVAEAMIRSVRQHSVDTGQQIGARIGIAVGPAAAGVLGGVFACLRLGVVSVCGSGVSLALSHARSLALPRALSLARALSLSHTRILIISQSWYRIRHQGSPDSASSGKPCGRLRIWSIRASRSRSQF